MWADTLLSAERAHVLRLLVWAASSVLVGTALFAALRTRRRSSALLEQFAVQTTAWGALELLVAAVYWAGLGYRDLASATRLDRMLWMNAGLECGFVLVGLVVVAFGVRPQRRLGVMGAGAAIIVQGLALLLLTLTLAVHISR